MPDFCSRLVEERKRLGLNQSEFGALGGVTKDSQLNYEKGTRRPDSVYLEALAAHDVDVAYLLTGRRMSGGAASSRVAPAANASGADDGDGIVRREITPEEAALLDNYNAADERGRAAARSVLDALAKQKAA